MKKLLFTLLAVSTLFSCKLEKSKNAEQVQEKQVIHDIDQLLRDLPNPADVPVTLKSINADFTDSLVNSLENMSKYAGNEDKLALNMGVYTADVSYLASYGQKDLTMDYVKACHNIGETLGDSAIFQANLLTKIEANLDSEHQLADLLRGMIVETSVQLERDHHLSMAALALTGSFIEELFQAVNVIENYHGKGQSKEEDKATVEPLVSLVLKQEQPLLDLIQLLNDIPRDQTISEMITHLNILDRLYKNELASIKAKMERDTTYVPDRGEMLAVTLEIERIRKKIVE